MLPTEFIYSVVPMGSLPQSRDVVELLLDAHTEVRQIVSMAQSLAEGNATSGARETATTVAEHVQWLYPLHCEDEDRSLAPRLQGRNDAVDQALVQMQREHLSLEAPLARVRLVCTVLSRDISRLHALRFELVAASGALRTRLAAHHAFEESIIFPALKRLLYVDELEAIHAEMRARRDPLAA